MAWPACRMESFLPLSEHHTRGQANCPGCFSPASYKREKSSIEVAHRLDSRIDRAAGQGVLAHLLAIAALRSQNTELHLLAGGGRVVPRRDGEEGA